MKHRTRTQLLGHYLKRAKGAFSLGLVLTIVAVGADLLGPYLFGYIIDTQLVEGQGIKDGALFIWLLVALGLSYVGSGVFRFGSMYYFKQTANKIARFMQEDLFAKVQSYPISYFDSLPAGKVVSRITTDTKDTRVLYQVVLSQLLNVVVYTVGIYGALFFIDRYLFILALIPMPLLFLIMWDYRKKSSIFNREYRRLIGEINANLNENIRGIEMIKSFSREATISDEFDALNEELHGQNMSMVKLESYSSYNLTETLQFLSIASVLLYFGYGSITGAYPVTIGSAYVYVDYMMKIFNQMQGAIMRLGELERANSAADNMIQMLERDGVKEGDDANSIAESSVTFDDVSFSYVPGEQVLKHVNFHIPAGQTAAFVGRTGSGKSTIMNLLFRYYAPECGEIRIGNANMQEKTLQRTRETMAIVLQDPQLFTGTVGENIRLFRDTISDAQAKDALIQVGGEQLLKKLPQGLDTPINEKAGNLSAGEKQLISFARAFVTNPEILVLDEATANIDSQTESVIQQGMKVLAEGRTTLIIAHRLSTIQHADQIFLLERGEIIEEGTHQTLMQQNGVYAEMVRTQK